nr:hypothetical protein [uncultured Carboxylicivirga sp.]
MAEKRLNVLCAIILLIVGNSIAQTSTKGRILAKIQDQTTDNPVPFAFVANSKTGIGKETNEKGIFRMDIESTDTLLFRCMGFEDNNWVLADLDISNDTLVLNVTPKAYALDEIKVFHFRSYASFRSMVANMPMMETGEYILPFKIDIKEALAFQKAEKGDFSFSLNFGGKSQTHDQKYYNHVLAEEQRFSLYNKVTSRDNIQAFTQLEGASLDSFIVFLRTKHNIDPKLSEYDMMVEVSKAYDNFLACKTDSISTTF